MDLRHRGSDKTMTDDKVPAAPRGLQARGRRLWREVLADHELRPDELTVLAAACRTADEVTTLEAALVGAEVMVEGSTGQQRPNPLFRETREHRKALAALLKQLGLVESDEDGGTVVPLHISAARRAAVNTRWARERGERA
jgi:phage terminase small subunit